MNPAPLDAYRRAAAPPGSPAGPGGNEPEAGQAGTGRPWIGVQFTCAGKYVRVFRRGDGAGYLARCPACAKTMWFRVGSGGTGDRFFELSCRYPAVRRTGAADQPSCSSRSPPR